MAGDQPLLRSALELRDAGRLGEAKAQLERQLALTADDAPTLAALSHVHLMQGDVAGAELIAARLVEMAPGSGAAARAAARVALRAGAPDRAETHARHACQVEPHETENQAVLAASLVQLGQFDEALRLIDGVLAGEPRKAAVLVLKADLQARRGEARAAADTLEAAIAAGPHLRMWANIARLRLTIGEAAAARAAFQNALRDAPGDVGLALGSAEAARRMGRLAEAEQELRGIVETAPDHSGAWMNLAVLLRGAGRWAEARIAGERALALDPDNAAALLNLANLLAAAGEVGDVPRLCARAMALQPNAALLTAIGDILQSISAGDEAEAAYRQALEQQAGDARARAGLARLLAERNETAAARALREALFAERPGLDAFLNASLLLPVIPGSLAEIDAARAKFQERLQQGSAIPPGLREPGAMPYAFYLAYHGRDDRPLMEGLDTLLRAKAPELSHVAREAVERQAPRPGARIRVGFVSQFLFNHTVGRVFEGLIRRLDRSRFEVVVAHLPHARNDDLRRQIDAAADQALNLPADLGGQRTALAAARLDLLVFTDIGMASASYALARSRLAPIQAVGWGHPDTTGLGSIDYYLSWDLAEPQGAEAHYSERLVRLPRLACYYEPPAAPAPVSRQSLGLPDEGRLYGCLQSLFKLHPDFDAVLAEIAARDPTGWLVFADGPHPNWQASLRRRWQAHGALNARAVFVPRGPFDEYLARLAAMDVLLDPAHFGSGATFYDAMSLGAAVVTWPGAFARGRVVAAAYRQMEAGEGLVAKSLADYATLALRTAEDRPPPQQLRAAADAQLFRDDLAVRAMEDFLAAAVAARAGGEALPRGWRPAEQQT